MKYSLKVVEFHLKPGSHEEMQYTDDKGELFIGTAGMSLLTKLIRLKSAKNAWEGIIVK